METDANRIIAHCSLVYSVSHSQFVHTHIFKETCLEIEVNDRRCSSKKVTLLMHHSASNSSFSCEAVCVCVCVRVFLNLIYSVFFHEDHM